MPRGVCVNAALTSPERSSSSSSSRVYNYSLVADPAHHLTDQQGETVKHNTTGHSLESLTCVIVIYKRIVTIYTWIHDMLLLHSFFKKFLSNFRSRLRL